MHRSLQAIEEEIHEVVVAMPFAAEHPLAAGQRGKLSGNPESCWLVAHDAILGEDPLSKNLGVDGPGLSRGLSRQGL